MSERADVAKTIFINEEHELRCGWRILVFLVVFLIALTSLTVLVTALGTLTPGIRSLISLASPDTSIAHRLAGSFLNAITLLTAALAASLFCARVLERRSLSSIGFMLHSGWFRDFSSGLLLGTVTLSITVAIMALAGEVSFEVRGSDVGRLASIFVALLLFFLLAAAFEELFVRGFVFQAIAHNVGPVVAIAVTSVAFSLLHIRNPNLTLFSLINTILAGVWLGVAYWKTRSLWLATALHAGWNFAMVFIFGLPVSGLTSFTDFAWLSGRSNAPTWLSGGDYGPEGGVAATAALILSTLVIWRPKLFRPSTEIIAAMRHGSRATKTESDHKQLEQKEQV